MRWNPVPFFLLCGAAAMLGAALWRDRPPELPPIEALTGFQDAGSPLLLPADGQPRHRLHEPSAWSLGEVPVALRFDAPAGSEHGALTMEKDGGITGIGGGSTAAGDPVFAAGDGLVIFAGTVEQGGRGVVLAHRDAEGRLLRSSYGPLGTVDVAVGSLVPRGKRIGTFGASGSIRHEVVPVHVREQVGDEDLMPSMLGVLLSPEMEPWTGLEIQGADKLGEILEK